MNKKIPIDELTRLAFIHAEYDRMDFAECNPAGSPERIEAEELVRQLGTYRRKRWGLTRLESSFKDAKLVEIRLRPPGAPVYIEDHEDGTD